MQTKPMLLASDYDKTFFYKDRPGELKYNLSAVDRWQNRGHKFVISTGRDAASIGFETRVRGVKFDYLVSLNGSFIVDSQGKVLFKQALEPVVAHELAEILKEEVGDELIVSNGFDGCNFTNKAKSKVDPVAKEVFERNSQIYSKTVETALQGEVLLLGCLKEDLDEAKALRERILKGYGDKVEVFINLNYINIVPKGISKASGLELVADLIGAQEENTFVIGDDYNDIPMLERFRGYAVDNAKPEVKEVAEKVFTSVAKLIAEKLADEEER